MNTIDIANDVASQTAAEATGNARARRPKPQLSCVPCRSKKTPHGQCVYLDSSVSAIAGKNSEQSENSEARIRNRLHLLESRIAQLTQRASDGSIDDRSDIHVSHHPIGDASASVSHERTSTVLSPRLSNAQQDQHFISPSHWEDILNDLEGLKLELDTRKSQREILEPETQYGQPTADRRPHLLFLDERTPSLTELISAVPGRSVVDILVNIFFVQNGLMPLISVLLHTPSFFAEYELFWEQPRGVDLNWPAILFSIMCLSLQAEMRAGRHVNGILIMDATCGVYSKKAVLCLRAADFARPSRYTVEALTFSLACEQFWIENEPYRASLALSMIVQTAFRMGYHKDPSHYAKMSVFEGEMQRRNWALLLQMDLFLASKCGLPPLIDQSQADTAPPANLTDSDLAAHMIELPPRRLDHEPTVIGYLNYKTRLATIHRRIFDRLNASDALNYDEVVHLDNELMEQVKTRPHWLRPPQAGTPYSRDRLGPLIDADLIVHRARMVLHRKFMIAARQDWTMAPSRNHGLDSAKQALFYQRILFESITITPMNGEQNWRLLSLFSQDFLYAGLLLSMDANSDLQAGAASDTMAQASSSERIGEHLEILRKSYMIWQQSTNRSATAKQAHDIIGALLNSFANVNNQRHMVVSATSESHHDAFTAQSEVIGSSHNQTVLDMPLLGLPRVQEVERMSNGSNVDMTFFNDELTSDTAFYPSDGHILAYNMADAFLLKSQWPNLDFTTAVGML